MGAIDKFLHKIVGDRINIAAWLSFGLFLYLLIYLSYQGITTSPETPGHDIDSIVYHIPIAQNIASGKLLPPDLPHGLGYYPAVGESILAIFIILGNPLNLFNVLGLILLFTLCRAISRRFGLSNAYSTIFAVSVVSLNSVTRLTNSQSVDILLAIFFLIALYLLQIPSKSFLYFIKLGIAVGLLIGVKYSGVLFAGILILFYFRQIVKNMNFAKFLTFSIPILILGLSWYIRNYTITGNPMYPGGLFGLHKHPDFMVQNWYPIVSLLQNPSFITTFFLALVSEYLIWSVTLFMPFVILYFEKLKRINFDQKIKHLAFLGLANFGVYLFIPSNPGAVVSDVRYLFPSLIPLILATFLLAQKYKRVNELSIVALFSSYSVLAQLEYRPKLVFVWLILISFLLINSNSLKLRLKL